MICSVRSFKTLLAVEVFRMTGDQLYNLKEKYLNQNHFYNDILPQYCLSEQGFIKNSEHLHWFSKNDKTNYTLFNAQTADSLLGSEIQNIGLEDLLEEQDVRQIFSKIEGISYEDFFTRLRPANYLVIQIDYWGYGEDFESAASAIGYMLNDLEFKKIESTQEVYKEASL